MDRSRAHCSPPTVSTSTLAASILNTGYGGTPTTSSASSDGERSTASRTQSLRLEGHPTSVAFLAPRYWIGRNSWGTYWGENGFFRIVRGDARMNLGIENDCTWATPKIPKHLLPDDPLPECEPFSVPFLDPTLLCVETYLTGSSCWTITVPTDRSRTMSTAPLDVSWPRSQRRKQSRDPPVPGKTSPSDMTFGHASG